MFFTVKNLSFLLAVTSSSLYLTGIMVSPIYGFAILSFGLFVFLNLIKPLKTKTNRIILPLIFLFSLVITQISKVPINIILNVIVFCLIIFMMATYYNNIDGEVISKVTEIYLWLSVTLFITDAIWRFSHPGYDSIQNIERLNELGLSYAVYKINSIMYADSNTVGFHALVIFMLSLITKNIPRLNLLRVLLFISICLTLSRTSVACAVIGSFWYYYSISFSSFRSKLISKIVIVVVLCFPLYELFIELWQSQDVSLSSKFYLISSMYDYLINSLNGNVFNLMFGVGLGNAVDILGIGSHSLYVTLVIELGLFVSFVYILMLLSLYSMSSTTKYIMVPVLIHSISLGSLVAPYLFVSLWLVIIGEKIDGDFS